jgi:hypothetical protein
MFSEVYFSSLYGGRSGSFDGYGLPFETIISATQLDPEKVKALYQQ